MKRAWFAAAAAAVLVFLPAFVSAALPSTGQWSFSARGAGDAAQVQLRLEYSHADAGGVSNGTWSFPVAFADVGLTPERLRAPIAPYTFRFAREAGTFDCTGTAGDGGGAGQYTFAVNASFGDALASRGIGRPTFDQSLTLAMSGTTVAFVDQLARGGTKPTVEQLVRLGTHGIGPQYVADLGSAGYRFDNADALVRLHDHGVTSEYVRNLQSAGVKNLSADDLVRLADHGVRSSYVRTLTAAGYRLSADEMVRLADHGVTSSYIDALSKHGYTRLSADDLIRLRDHGITVAFIDRLQSHGYKNLPVNDLVRLRDNGF